MIDFSKKSEVEEYFDEIIPLLRQREIRAICTAELPCCDYRGERSECETTGEIYILFHGSTKVLVISYPLINSLDVHYRELSSFECWRFNDLIQNDIFNRSDDIYAGIESTEIICTKSCSLEYGAIKSIVVDPLQSPYSVMSENRLCTEAPSEETFLNIHFHMDNGNIFTIGPDSAISGGFTLVWSYDTNTAIIEHDDA